MVDDGHWRVEVLGRLRVLDPTRDDVASDGSLQRRLLALLFLQRDLVLTVDAAVDALGPAEAPRDPVAALQNHVFRLRPNLRGGLIESTAEGYRLTASGVELDADHLVARLSQAEEHGGAKDAAPGEIAALLARCPRPRTPR